MPDYKFSDSGLRESNDIITIIGFNDNAIASLAEEIGKPPKQIRAALFIAHQAIEAMLAQLPTDDALVTPITF